MSIVKKYGVDFSGEVNKCEKPSLTFPQCSVAKDKKIMSGTHKLIYDTGWTITAKLQQDHHVWVNDFWINKFEATHPIYGGVCGDFEDEVHADSEEGYQHFCANHKPETWSNYWDV